MRSRVRFPVLPWGFFLEWEESHGDHCLGSLVELRFKAPPGTSYSYITIHFISIYHHPLHIHIPPSTSYPYISIHFISIYHHPHHQHNVTAPHGRPNLRSRLHFGHIREGRPRSPKGQVEALERE